MGEFEVKNFYCISWTNFSFFFSQKLTEVNQEMNLLIFEEKILKLEWSSDQMRSDESNRGGYNRG